MAKSVLERCESVIGDKADFLLAIAKFQKPDDEETYYRFGVWFTYPDGVKALEDEGLRKLAEAGYKRILSVAQAPFPAKIKAGEMGKLDIIDFFNKYDGDKVYEAMAEEKKRAGGGGVKVSSTESLITQHLAKLCRDKQAAGKLTSAVELPEVPKTEKGSPNWTAFAKALKEMGHPWYATVAAKYQVEDEADELA